MIEVVPTRYGTAAFRALAEVVAAGQAGDPLAPVTVVVPSNYAGVATRRWLAAHGRGIAGLNVVTLYRLAEQLAAPRLAGDGRRPVTAPIVTAAIRRALAETPGMFADVAGQPGTVEAMHNVHRELRELSDAQLRALAGASVRARDTVALHRRTCAILDDGGWFDERDLLDAAATVAERGPPDVPPGLATVVVHLPQELPVGARRLLRALSGRAGVVAVCGLTGIEAADAATYRVLRERLGVRIAPELPPPSLFDVVEDAPTTLTIDATDPDDEVREAVRQVIAAAGAGTPFERIAVVYPSPRPYARLLADHLTAAEVPWNGAATVALRERIAGRALLGALDLGDRELPRHELFGLLSSIPVVAPGGSPLPVARWEARSREAGVVGGIEQWRQRLALLAERYARRPRQQDTAVEAPTPTTDGRVADIQGLGRFVDLLHRRLTPPRSRTWPALCAWAAGLIDLLVGGEDVRESWPPDERRAADRVHAAIDRLRHLDLIDPNPALSTFRQALTAELDAALTTVGRLGQGVFVAPIGLAVGVDADLVVVLGAAEGLLPPLTRDDPLLRDRDRRAVGLLAATDTVRERAHHQVVAVARSARRQLVACRPRGDLRASRGLHPSRWLADIVGHEPPPTRHIGSFRDGIHSAPIAATEQEALLAVLDRGQLIDEDEPIVGADPALRRSVRLRHGRASDAFTEYDGNLAVLAPLPTVGGERPLSPSRLELWMRCPYAYFVRYLLRVDPVEAPEDLLELSALERGSLVHAALEELVRGGIDGDDLPGPGEPWSTARVDQLDASLQRLAADAEAQGMTGLPLFWSRQQRKIRRWLQAFLVHDAELRGEHLARPVAVEIAFGVDASPAVEIRLPSGRELRLAGRIDRIDCGPRGIVVVDYKTTKRSRLGVSSNHPLGRGSDRLQLPIYGLAAQRLLDRPDDPVHVCYLSVSDEPGAAVQVLDPATLAKLDEVVEITASGIEGGVFPPHPEGGTAWLHHVSCWYCDPDGLGTSSGRARWERKREDPALTAYVGLVEP